MADKELTVRDRKFMKDYFITGNATASAMKTCNCKNDASAAVLGHKIIRKVKKSGLYDAFLDKNGLSDGKLIEKHTKLLDAQKLHICDIHVKQENGKIKINKNSNDFIAVDDSNVQLGALKLAYQLKGNLQTQSKDGQNEKPDVNISITVGKVDVDERIKLLTDSRGGRVGAMLKS